MIDSAQRPRHAICIGLFLALIQSMLSAQDLTLAPLNGSPFRLKDMTGHHYSDAYKQTYSYATSSVTVTFDAPGKPYLAGLLRATGLKPNFAYQIKLSGRNSKVTTNNPDDATNERLGLIGRWWRANPNPANANDPDYFAHKDDPTYAYSGYLIIGFFATDDTGAATVRLEGSNSFHVLWRTDQRPPSSIDGPVQSIVIPATAGNPAYGSTSATPAATIGLYGEGEPTRALPNALVMPEGRYACDFVLTEESFHDFGIDAGNWTSVMGAPIVFDIGSAPPQNPLIASGPLATPNPAQPGEIVRCSAAGTSPDVTLSWNFGDGSPSATGSSVEHVYSSTGKFTLTLTATKTGRAPEIISIPIDVITGAPDSDGDGFSNSLEAALSSDSMSANSTPLNAFKSPGNVLFVTRCVIRVSDVGAKIQFAARLDLAKFIARSNATIALDVGGNVLVFKLDSHGRARSAGRSASLLVNANREAFVRISAQNFNAPLTGLLSSPPASGVVSVPMMLLIGDSAVSAPASLTVKNANGAFLLIKK